MIQRLCSRGRPGRRRGFTLVELMVAMAITGLLVTSALGVFIQHRWILKSNQIVNEVQQNTRTAVDMLARDIRMAGYGMGALGIDPSGWVDWTVDLTGSPIDMDENPKIVDGDTGADSIWIAGAFGDPVASLAAASSSGSTTITVGSGEGTRFNVSDKKLIYIGKCETARITSVSGDVLSISTHVSSSQGLRYDHPAGSDVELVRVRSYQVTDESVQYPYQPYLTRDDSIANSFDYYWQRLVAAGIDDMQIVRDGHQVDIEVTGLASVPDRIFFGGDDGTTKTRRIEVESSVYMRNQP